MLLAVNTFLRIKEVSFMKRLIFFVGVYDTLDIFTYELQKEFKMLHYETMIFDVNKAKESLIELADFVQKPVTAAITFNNLGYNMELEEGKNIWEQLRVPCINILMDHPFCYKKALDDSPSNAVVLCTDRNHMKYLNRFYPQIPITGFLPHAGKESILIRRPLSERNIDVMYAGNLSRSFVENIMPDFSKYHSFDAKKICQEAYNDLIAHPSKTTEQALEDSLLAAGIVLEDNQLKDVISDLHFVDLYAVSYFREKAVQVLAEDGIQIALYGAGWDQCEWVSKPNVFYGGKVPAEEIVEKMADAKIVLNTMTWFKDGTHDRIFNGMLQGAVVVSDSSVYMNEEFSESEIVFFALEEINGLPRKVHEILDDLPKYQRIADEGYNKAKQFHTWKNRAWELEHDLLCQI